MSEKQEPIVGETASDNFTKDAMTAAAVAQVADAVVVGSALIKQVEATPDDHPRIIKNISGLLASMRTAVDA